MTFDLDQRCVLNTPDRPSAAPNRVRVLVADDHPAVRCALESLVRACSELELVGSACTGEEAVATFLEGAALAGTGWQLQSTRQRQVRLDPPRAYWAVHRVRVVRHEIPGTGTGEWWEGFGEHRH